MAARGLRQTLLLGLAVALVAGCDLPAPPSKTREARVTGNLVRPPAARLAVFAAELVGACGDGQPTDAGATRLRRLPYVQHVTTSAATVMWTDAVGADATLEVTTPAGDLVVRLPVAADPGALTRDHQFEARFEGLAPDTVYCYRPFVGDEPLAATAGFRTAPESGTGAGPVRFVAFGDSGDGSPDQYAVTEQLETVPYDLALHLGDITFSWGTPEQIEAWFFDVYADIIRHVPVFPVAGNHDYVTAEGAPVRSFFALPENGGPAGRERWFSFDWGDVHFVGLDSQVMDQVQLDWLDADLAATERPWTVVYLHRPLTSWQGGGATSWRATVLDTVARHGGGLVLAGHYHRYSRAHPVKGVYEIVSGGGGAELHDARDTDVLAFSVSVLHFVHVEVTGDVLVLRAIDATGREFDQLEIRRGAED